MDTHDVDTEDFGRVLLARVALATLVEPGDRLLHHLVAAVGPVEALAALSSGDFRLPLTRTRRQLASGDPMRQAEDLLTRSSRLGARVLIPEDDEWPTRLIDLEGTGTDEAAGSPAVCPPMCLWVVGPENLATTLDRSVAVVGAHAATSYGTTVATELGRGLAGEGWTVVAGGGFGIEAAAHRGALAAGGMSVAVLPGGHDRAHPAVHASLFAQISQQGLLISQYPPGSEPQRLRFRAGERLLAALTGGTVLVEAGALGGTRQAPGAATALGRPVMAVPGPVTSAMSAGCHHAIRNGARLVTGARDVLAEIERVNRQPRREQSDAEAAMG